MRIGLDKSLWPETCHGRWMSEEYEAGLVSVIVPTYNRATLLRRCLGSVFSQSYRPIELIVVDDGSTDDTRIVLREWRIGLGDDPLFGLKVHHQKKHGACYARNAGFRYSRGEFVAFLDSDDYMLPSRIELQVDKLLESGAQMCCASTHFIAYGDGKEECPSSSTDVLLDFVNGVVPGHTTSWLFERAILVGAGLWDESLICYQDQDLLSRCLLLRPRAAFEPAAMTAATHDDERHVYQNVMTPDGLSSVYRSCHRFITGLRTLPKWQVYARGEAERILRFAVYGYAIRARRVACQLEHMACRLSAEACWGEGRVKRLAYRVGGARLCGELMRLKWSVRRLCRRAGVTHG